MESGERSRGGYKKTFKDCIHIEVNNIGISDNYYWEILAETRNNLRKINTTNKLTK